MAIGGKTLGIVSGLAVGLTSGVILAALNPIVPQKGEPADTQPIKEAVVAPEAEENADPALPKLSMVDTSETSENEETIENDDVAETTTEPKVEPAPSAEVVDPVEEQPALIEPSVEVSLPEQPESLDADTNSATEQAAVLSENAITADTAVAPEEPATASNDTQPNIATEPAEAIKLAEPVLDTESPEVNVAKPAPTDPIKVSEVAEAVQAEEPSALIPTETVVASLPIVEEAEAPKAKIAPVEDLVDEVVADAAKPNTSGTFKTTGGSLITRGSNLPKIGEDSVAGLPSLGTAAKSSRFKTIGETDTSESAVAEKAENKEENEPNLGALARNANEFPVTDTPLVSIILLDDGRIFSQLKSLKTLNLPLTIAVSLDDADAAERAAQYRAAGFEILTMSPRNVQLSLSGGQTDDQVATLLDQYFEIMPQSVGLIDRPSANLQKDQRLSRYVVEHFSKTGHGLITYAGGLNGTKRIADQENVSSGSVFRFLDKSGEAGPIITQHLDRAAREARSKGSAIVMATPSDATLSTLVSWSLSTKARAIRMAPISASLLKD